jgi:hypothetical protein
MGSKEMTCRLDEQLEDFANICFEGDQLAFLLKCVTELRAKASEITQLQTQVEALEREKQVSAMEYLVLEGQFREHLGKIEGMRKDAGWQPIETAPKDKYILVTDFGEYPDAPDIYVAEWFDLGKYWSTSHGRVHGVSHWMPLPKPPIEGEAT